MTLWNIFFFLLWISLQKVHYHFQKNSTHQIIRYVLVCNLFKTHLIYFGDFTFELKLMKNLLQIQDRGAVWFAVAHVTLNLILTGRVSSGHSRGRWVRITDHGGRNCSEEKTEEGRNSLEIYKENVHSWEKGACMNTSVPRNRHRMLYTCQPVRVLSLICTCLDKSAWVFSVWIIFIQWSELLTHCWTDLSQTWYGCCIRWIAFESITRFMIVDSSVVILKIMWSFILQLFFLAPAKQSAT